MRPVERLRRSLGAAPTEELTAERDEAAALGEGPGGRATHLRRTFSSLSIPAFRNLWFGVLFGQAAMQMNLVARSWLALELTGSATAIGLVAASRALPQLLVGPVAGVIADHYPKRRILVTVYSALSVLAVLAAVLVEGGRITIWQLTLISLAQGVAFSFSAPVRQAFIAELVGRERLPNALAINSLGLNANQVLSPAIGGVLLAWHPAAAFHAIAVLYVCAALTLTGLPAGAPVIANTWSSARQVTSGVRGELVDGFRYIAASPVLLALLGIAFVPVFLGMPYTQLLPVFQADVLRVGEAQLGLMYGVVGLGALPGSLAIASFSQYPHKRTIQSVAGFGFGATLALFALSDWFLLSLVVLFFLGMASQAFRTMNNVLLMSNTDRAYFGRVASVYVLTFQLVPLGLLPMGIAIDRFGAQPTMAVVGALLSAFVVAVSVLYPGYRQLDRRTAALD